LPLIEQYPNYKFLQTSFRHGRLDNLRKTFYQSEPVWNQRGSNTFFAECGWYKYPYCCFSPYYEELNIPDIIGLLQTEIYNASVDIVKEVWVALYRETNEQWMPFGAELNLVYPGAKILPHTDNHFYSNYATRCHVVLETNDDVKFIFANNDSPKFKLGDSFIFNNKRKHEIYNNGDSNRLHFVIDFLPVEIFPYTERILAPFGPDNSCHIVNNIRSKDHPLHDKYVEYIDDLPYPTRK
tara:strand:- start:271 stop:987 length:717 start_codon:yes stop_codon:yes gene_type:complete